MILSLLCLFTTDVFSVAIFYNLHGYFLPWMLIPKSDNTTSVSSYK